MAESALRSKIVGPPSTTTNAPIEADVERVISAAIRSRSSSTDAADGFADAVPVDIVGTVDIEGTVDVVKLVDVVRPMDIVGLGPDVGGLPTGAATLTAGTVVAAPTTETGPVPTAVVGSETTGGAASLTPVMGGPPTGTWERAAAAIEPRLGDAKTARPTETTKTMTANGDAHRSRRRATGSGEVGLPMPTPSQGIEAGLDSEQTR